MSRAAEILRAACDVIRDSEQAYGLVDTYYKDRGIDADAEDVARALDEAAVRLNRSAES